MNIAVNARFLLKGKLEGIGYFTQEVFNILARQYPEHRFYFLFDRPYNKDLIVSNNIHPLGVPFPTRHPILWKYWYDIKLPLILRKIKADVFVSTDGFCSLNSKVPQCLVVHDLGFLHQPAAYKKSHLWFYRFFTPKFLRKAKTLATVSEFSKTDIVDSYHIKPEKIRVVYSAAKEIFRPLPFEEQWAIKEKHAGGKEYFLYAGAIQPRKNIINLLKAFSVFKKRQKSEMKLILVGRIAWKNTAILQSLKTYKYRQDVILTGYLEETELVKLMSACYAFIYPSVFEGFGVPVIEAMKCQTPVLTSANSSMQEIAEDAALYFNPADYQDIADKLMLIYKDENKRAQLVEKGKHVADRYSWDRTANLLWHSILDAVPDKTNR